MDRGWTDRRLAGWEGDEGRWVRSTRRHHSWHPRRCPGRLGLRDVRNLAGRRHDRVDSCGVCWRRDFDLAYPLAEKSLKRTSHILHAEKQPVGNALSCSRRLREDTACAFPSLGASLLFSTDTPLPRFRAKYLKQTT